MGMESVSPRVIAVIVNKLNSLANTIVRSERGSVIRTSIVLACFSSLILFIEMAGISINKSHGATPKNGFKDAEPTTKTSLMNKYPRKRANTIGTE
jgi:hypothetical protein